MAAPPSISRARELVVVSVVALALSVVFTWPLASRFSTAGRVDSGDGRFSIWNVAWVAHALTTNPAELWNANIFYPHTGTLAFSEANLVAGILATPAWLLTHNPYATSNWTILCSFTLSALTMFALVRYLTGNRWGAAFAGVTYSFCSYSFSHLAHIQLLMTFGPPLALLRMHLFVAGPTLRNAIWLGVALALQGLACGYYGVFGGLTVGFGLVWFAAWSGQFLSRRFWLLTAAACAVALLVTAPFFLPYLSIQRAGFERTLEDARTFRAGWRSYLASPLWVYQWILPLIGHWRAVLFPGLVTLALAAVGVTRAIRQPGRVSSSGQVVWFYVLVTILAAWASFGPDAGLYRVIYAITPFMSMLRVPARLGLLVTLATAVLAGYGLSALERAWVGPRRRVWLAALVLISLARSTTGPLDWAEAPAEPRAIQWLGTLPRGPVAAFPFFGHPEMARETNYMLQSTWHWQPMLNGYSDFVPNDISADHEMLSSFPSPAAIRVLRDRQTKYVLVNWGLYSEAERDRVRLGLSEWQASLRPMLNDPETSLFELTPTEVSVR